MMIQMDWQLALVAFIGIPIIALIKFFPGVRADASAVAVLNKVLELEKSRIILYTLAVYAILTILSWLLANCGFRKRSF